MEWHHPLPSAEVVPAELSMGLSHIAATARGGQYPPNQQLQLRPAGTGRDGPAEALTHLGTASVTSHVSSTQKRCQTRGIALPLLVWFFFSTLPYLWGCQQELT